MWGEVKRFREIEDDVRFLVQIIEQRFMLFIEKLNLEREVDWMGKDGVYNR